MVLVTVGSINTETVSLIFLWAFTYSGPQVKSVSDLSKLCRSAVMVETFGMFAAKKFIIPRKNLIPALPVGLVILTIALTFIMPRYQNFICTQL